MAAQPAPTGTLQGDGAQPFWGGDTPVMDPKKALGHSCCEVTRGHPPRAFCPLQPLFHRMAQGRLDLGWRRGAQGPAQGGLSAGIPGRRFERSGLGPSPLSGFHALPHPTPLHQGRQPHMLPRPGCRGGVQGASAGGRLPHAAPSSHIEMAQSEAKIRATGQGHEAGRNQQAQEAAWGAAWPTGTRPCLK